MGARAALGEALDAALVALGRLFVVLDTERLGVLVPTKVHASLKHITNFYSVSCNGVLSYSPSFAFRPVYGAGHRTPGRAVAHQGARFAQAHYKFSSRELQRRAEIFPKFCFRPVCGAGRRAHGRVDAHHHGIGVNQVIGLGTCTYIFLST